MREQVIQKKICDYLVSLGSTIPMVYTAAGIYAKKGVSDILCCYKGRFLAIEVKRPGEKPTPIQLLFIEGINKCGGIGFWATSVEDVKKELERRNLYVTSS